MIKEYLLKTQLWLIGSLTLGLAPFTPEPHIWGKLRWIKGGAVGMGGMDWFDFFFHGLPWFLLIISIVMRVGKYFKGVSNKG